MYQLYTLRLNFNEPAVYIEKFDRMVYTNEQYQDDITFACCVELAARGVHCTQSQHNTLTFENSRDYTYATLFLSDRTEYTVEHI